MLVPDGFVLPIVIVPLVIVLAGVVAMLWVLEPPVTDRVVLAFAPWMMLGSTLHVLYQIDAVPPLVAPLVSAPSVYLTTAVVGGSVWILATFLYAGRIQRSIGHFVGVVGLGLFAVAVTYLLVLGWRAGRFEPLWPVLSIVAAGAVAAVAWVGLSLWFTEAVATTGATGAFVVFAHTLDGVTTAVGVDVLDASERVPASRFVLEVSGSLATAEFVGVGWLFVVVKVLLALVIVGLFTDYVREEPERARIVLALVAAVGFGPGIYNVLFFTVA